MSKKHDNRKQLHNIGFGDGFFEMKPKVELQWRNWSAHGTYMKPKAHAMTTKREKLDYIKIRELY